MSVVTGVARGAYTVTLLSFSHALNLVVLSDASSSAVMPNLVFDIVKCNCSGRVHEEEEELPFIKKK